MAMAMAGFITDPSLRRAASSLNTISPSFLRSIGRGPDDDDDDDGAEEEEEEEEEEAEAEAEPPRWVSLCRGIDGTCNLTKRLKGALHGSLLNNI